MADKKNFSVIPSELRLSQKWDFAIENFITRPALGLAIGGLFGVVLFSSRNLRMGSAIFGMGFGCGDAFRVSNHEFEKEATAVPPPASPTTPAAPKAAPFVVTTPKELEK